MSRSGITLAKLAALFTLSLALASAEVQAGETIYAQEFRTQKVGDVTYFHAILDAPRGLYDAHISSPPTERDRRQMALLPRLVPQDDSMRAICLRPQMPSERWEELQVTRAGRLEFVGIWQPVNKGGIAEVLLHYPIEEEVMDTEGQGTEPLKPRRQLRWVAVRAVLDRPRGNPANIQRVPLPAKAAQRNGKTPPSSDDLEGLWAEAQAIEFAMLDIQSGGLGFYRFAREATVRKYRVSTPAWFNDFQLNQKLDSSRLYEMTTGATAIAESMQIGRLLGNKLRDTGERTIDINKVKGIDIAEHPWQKMMAGKKPVIEPLARLVPHDNYYVHFTNIRKLIEFSELLDSWGGNIMQAYEISSRDHQLQARYQKQLCLKTTEAAKLFGPAVVRSVAITGNDPYVREGSDVTLIFHVVNRKLFLNAVEPFLQEARKEQGSRLKESEQKYHDVVIESYVTPHREVSLHRAAFGDFVAYSNSPVGLRRVIDTHQGRLKALADSLDFQYMRTVFSSPAAADKNKGAKEADREDGFVFLSDPFIRQLVGPASKIKEKRRLEAVTSLHMVTHAALFTAWETSKLPANHAALLAASRLKPAEIYAPEGKSLAWDAKDQVAVSDAYNTVHFATPLIELPMDKITKDEEGGYTRFRSDYSRMWRGYFDPVGMRLTLSDKRICVETFILPLIQSSEYNRLREVTGGGTTTLDLATIPSNTLIHFMVHLRTPNPIANRFHPADVIGKWFLVRLDDSPLLTQLAELRVRQSLNQEATSVLEKEELRLLMQLPLVIGVQVRKQKEFDKELARICDFLEISGSPVTSETQKPAYKGVSIVRVTFQADSPVVKWLNDEATPKDKRFVPIFYHAKIDDAWYVSFQEAPLKQLIDHHVAKREGKKPAGKAEKIEINQSLYLSARAAVAAWPAIRFYLEWETHRRAVSNCAIWYPLYRCGLVDEKSSESQRRAVTMRYLGSVPISPDGAAYSFDRKAGEIVNARHGSLRQPRLHSAIDKKSPLHLLLWPILTLRADLRFREDGVHTVVTIDRMK